MKDFSSEKIRETDLYILDNYGSLDKLEYINELLGQYPDSLYLHGLKIYFMADHSSMERQREALQYAVQINSPRQTFIRSGIAHARWFIWPYDAEPKYREAIELDTENINVWARVGLALWNSSHKREYEAAATHYHEALTMYPDHPCLLSMLAEHLITSGEPEEAEQTLRRIPEEYDPAFITMLWGDLASLSENYEKAENLYEQSIALDGTNIEYYVQLIKAWLCQNKDQQVEVKLGELEQLFPDSAVMYYLKAFLLVKREEYEQARDLLLRAYELDSTLDDAVELLASVYISLGQYQAAWDAIHRFIGDNDNRSNHLLKSTLIVALLHIDMEEALWEIKQYVKRRTEGEIEDLRYAMEVHGLDLDKYL